MKITFLGDIMIDNETAKHLSQYYINGRYQFDDMFTNIKELLSRSDYVLANLETPISFDNSDLTDVQWQFCSPREFAESIKNAGIHFVSTANNHCLDRGIKGLTNTIDVLDEINLKHTGTFKTNHSRPLSIININGVKIGCLAYTYGTNAVTNNNYLGRKYRKCVNLIQEQEGYIQLLDPIQRINRKYSIAFLSKLFNKIDMFLFPENKEKEWFEKRSFDLYRRVLLRKDIRKIKGKSDIQILMLHIGGQYNSSPNEYTLKTVKRLQKKFNIIIANHEHVVHPHCMDMSNRHFAAYSLGNLISGSGTICKPFDKFSEYSIAVHFYIEEESKQINKITFSVLKVINDNNRLMVYPAFDLIKSNNNLKLVNDTLNIASRFGNRKYDLLEEEYELLE